MSDEDYVVYQCSKCREVSKWYFDALVPILIEKGDELNAIQTLQRWII